MDNRPLLTVTITRQHLLPTLALFLAFVLLWGAGVFLYLGVERRRATEGVGSSTIVPTPFLPAASNAPPIGAPPGIIYPTMNPTAVVLRATEYARRDSIRQAACAYIANDYAKYGATFYPRPDPDGIMFEWAALMGWTSMVDRGLYGDERTAFYRDKVEACATP